MITQTIKVNLIPGGILPRIKASQYDVGSRTIKFKIYNGTQEFLIPQDAVAYIRGTKSDNTGFDYECTFSGSEVTAEITDQMTVSPGEVLAEIVIIQGKNRIGTGNFIFDNEESALKEDVVISKTDIPVIEHIEDYVEDAKQAAEDAQDAVDDAEASATSAASSATAAATSATSAAGSATDAAASASSASTNATNAAASATSASGYASDAAESASQASQSATAAATSSTNAATNATDAAASASSASTSAETARRWAVGVAGSGSDTPSDTNNAYYWAQVAASAAAGGLNIEIVSSLPTTNISTHTLYMVPSSDPKTQNVKDEYLNTDGTVNGWELIGSTAIDLSGYYTKTQVDTLLQGVKDYADAQIAAIEIDVDEKSILKTSGGTIYVNQYDFDTMEELEQAIEDDEIPDGATIYIPGSGGGGGGSIGSYTYDAAERKLVVTGGSTEYEYDQTTRGIIIAT